MIRSSHLFIALLLVPLSQGCASSAKYAGGGAYAERSAPRSASPTSPPNSPEDVVRTIQSVPGVVVNGSAYGGEDEADGERDEAPAPPPPPPAGVKIAQNTGGQGDKKTDASPAPAEKDAGKAPGQRSPILIYTATFQMAVFEVSNSLAEVDRITREIGGFITKRTDRQITVRVPAARFYETVGRLEKLGDVTQRDVAAQDVTEEYLDTEVRLRNARAMRDRLEQLLAKATTVQDSLMIERELNRVASEIERMEGRLKYLRDRAAFSTITVSFEPRRVVTPPPSVRLPFPWLTRHGLARLLSL